MRMKTASKRILSTILITTFLFGASAVLSKTFAATLKLAPSTGSFAKGGSFVVTVVADTAGESIAGADIVLEYDTTRLRFLSVTEISGFSYPTKTESQGTILISANSTSGVTGSALELVKVTFTVLNTTGAANVDFVTEGALSSSVIRFGESTELLESTVDGVYTITEVSGAGDTTTPVGKGTTQPATGIFDSMGTGLLIAFVLLVTAGSVSYLAKKAYRQ